MELNSLIFPAPKPSYSLNTLEEIVFIPKKNASLNLK